MIPIVDTYTPKQVKKEFAIQPALNAKFWSADGVLDPIIRIALLKITKAFIDTLGVKLDIKDITFTGSLANFNYSSVSDVDLHVVADYSTLNGDPKLIEEYLALKKSQWNSAHQSLMVRGHPVEVYVEDEKAPHTTTGLYSLPQNKWIKKPAHSQPNFDPKDVATKANYFKSLYLGLLKKFRSGEYGVVSAGLASVRQDLKDMRKSGLLSGGEYSTENLAFKVLRRSGLIQKIIQLQNRASVSDASV